MKRRRVVAIIAQVILFLLAACFMVLAGVMPTIFKSHDLVPSEGFESVYDEYLHYAEQTVDCKSIITPENVILTYKENDYVKVKSTVANTSLTYHFDDGSITWRARRYQSVGLIILFILISMILMSICLVCINLLEDRKMQIASQKEKCGNCKMYKSRLDGRCVFYDNKCLKGK